MTEDEMEEAQLQQLREMEEEGEQMEAMQNQMLADGLDPAWLPIDGNSDVVPVGQDRADLDCPVCFSVSILPGSDPAPVVSPCAHAVCQGCLPDILQMAANLCRRARCVLCRLELPLDRFPVDMRMPTTAS